MHRLAVKLIFLSGEEEISLFKPNAKAIGFMVLDDVWAKGKRMVDSPTSLAGSPMSQVEQNDIYFLNFRVNSGEQPTQYLVPNVGPWNNRTGLLTLNFV